MKMDNNSSQRRLDNYKELSKYVIYVNPKQYVRMMRRRVERDRFLDRKGRPKKIYVPIAVREQPKRIIQHDDLISDLGYIKKIPSKRETPKNYEGIMNNPNCNNINIYINNPINNSNQVNNNLNNTNNFNNTNMNYGFGTNMNNWSNFYWNMSGYYNLNSNGYSSMYPNYTSSDGINCYQNIANNSGITVPPVKNMDYNNYNQITNTNYPNNSYYFNNNNNGNSNNVNTEMINKNKSINNEEFPNLVQEKFCTKGYEGLNSGFYSNTYNSSFYNINSTSDINNICNSNNFDSSSFSTTPGVLTSSVSITESHSSSSSSGYNLHPTEKDINNNQNNKKIINKNISSKEEIMNNYINMNKSSFSECLIDNEVICKTEQIYNINQNGTVIDTNLGNEITIGLNEPTFFNTNLINNIDENVIGNILDSNCVTSSCYLDTGNNGNYNETHLESILMDHNSINTACTIINDNELIFNTANNTNNNSINTSDSIHSLNSLEDRIQREGRESLTISTSQCDSNDSSYIYRQLCDYF